MQIIIKKKRKNGQMLEDRLDEGETQKTTTGSTEEYGKPGKGHITI